MRSGTNRIIRDAVANPLDRAGVGSGSGRPYKNSVTGFGDIAEQILFACWYIGSFTRQVTLKMNTNTAIGLRAELNESFIGFDDHVPVESDFLMSRSGTHCAHSINRDFQPPALSTGQKFNWLIVIG
jgi:hypothetical protein